MKKILLILCCIVLVNCKTQQSTTNTTQNKQTIQIDSVYITEFIKDTTFIDRQIYVEVKGDCKDSIVTQTIYKEKIIDLTQEQTSQQKDTIYIERDVIKKEYIEKELSWYQQTMIRLGLFFIVLVILRFGWFVLKKYIKI